MKKPKASTMVNAVWSLDRIKPYPNNPRTHPREQITLLAGLLTKFGPDQPIVVDEDGVILKGHGRRLAAITANMETFPVVQRIGMSEADKRAMRISDNQVALLSGWDQDLIQGEIGFLQAAGYDVPLLGFSEAALRGWSVPAGTAGNDPEDIPEPPKKPIVRAGDIWELGRHRLACMDATRPETWSVLLGSERAATVFTDPPYGVSYEARSGDFDIIQGDKKRRDDLYKMLVNSLRQMAKHSTDTAAFYIWHADKTRGDFFDAMVAAGLIERQYLIWVKPSLIVGNSDYQLQTEPCFYACKADRSPKFYGARAESTVWHVQLATAKDTAATVGNGILLLDGEGGTLYVQSKAPKNKKLRQVRVLQDGSVYLSGADRQDGTVWEVGRDSGHEHPTQKPVELARRAIENSSQPGEIVIDGFLGSSTTLIAAEMTARRCFGCELDPKYAEVGIQRWMRFAGQEATLDGKSFEQISRERSRLGGRKSPAGARASAAPESGI